MKVYRLSKAQYAEDLNGTGAKLYGGRWNHKETPCIYTAESRALAILEYTVNVHIDFIPRALSICVFEIDEKQIKTLKLSELPGDWKAIPASLSTKNFGTELLSQNHSIIRVPSIIIPEEYNYILNPLAKKPSFKLIEVKDFIFDLRIKTNQ